MQHRKMKKKIFNAKNAKKFQGKNAPQARFSYEKNVPQARL